MSTENRPRATRKKKDMASSSLPRHDTEKVQARGQACVHDLQSTFLNPRGSKSVSRWLQEWEEGWQGRRGVANPTRGKTSCRLRYSSRLADKPKQNLSCDEAKIAIKALHPALESVIRCKNTYLRGTMLDQIAIVVIHLSQWKILLAVSSPLTIMVCSHAKSCCLVYQPCYMPHLSYRL